MAEFLPGLITKNITFRRIKDKHVKQYKIQAAFKDSTYTSGIRYETLEVFDNPSVPSPVQKTIILPYNEDGTWKLPDDAYLDTDHKFKIYLNGVLQSTMHYSFNRISKLITLDKAIITYDSTVKAEMTYFQDVIKRSYVLEDDCTIYVTPVFEENYEYGSHNVII